MANPARRLQGQLVQSHTPNRPFPPTSVMHEFIDDAGATWTAAVVEQSGPDYKGRFVLQMRSADGARTFTLPEVAWNSVHSAQRTLETMSQFELRRRLRTGLKRMTTVATP